MNTLALDAVEIEDESASIRSDTNIRPIPRISIQAFCENESLADMFEKCAADRRMAKTHAKIHMGGISAAVEFYASAPTPNLIVIETQGSAQQVLSDLERLAEVCDAGTKVIVVGQVNDVLLYRELMRRGISEYLVAPIDLFAMMEVIGDLFVSPEAETLGKAIAFMGAKGGCGASTIAHNVSWAISASFESDVILADLDLPFGTAGLDFNQDPLQGIQEAVSAPDRLDDTLLDRLLTRCADHLSLLSAPASLEKPYDFGEETFDGLMDVMRNGVPAVILDVPHQWTSWVRRIMSATDEIVIVAEPELANLRNAKNLMDNIKQLRPNDPAPQLILNRVGVPKRPEIKPDEFASALDVEPVAIIPFEPQLFGTASNNGQMISEVDAKNQVGGMIDTIAQVVTGRMEVRKPKKSPLGPILARLRGKSKEA